MKRILIISNNALSDTQHNSKTILSLLGNREMFSLRQVFLEMIFQLSQTVIITK